MNIKLNFRKLTLGNWGKRELSTSSLTPDSIPDTNDGGTGISILYDEDLTNNFLLEQIRLVNIRKTV